MSKNYTLKELADIGAKAAYLAEKESKCTLCHAITVDASKPWYEETSVNREAFTKAVLDAIGYEFPKDEEREAFERWQTTVGWDLRDSTFEAWKAGREELRRATAIPVCAVNPDTKPKEPAWIPWDGGECPLADTVKRWEFQTRAGYSHMGPSYPVRWKHEGTAGDIVAYRVLEG